MFLPKKGVNGRASSYPKISLEMSTNQKRNTLEKDFYDTPSQNSSRFKLIICIALDRLPFVRDDVSTCNLHHWFYLYLPFKIPKSGIAQKGEWLKMFIFKWPNLIIFIVIPFWRSFCFKCEGKTTLVQFTGKYVSPVRKGGQ